MQLRLQIKFKLKLRGIRVEVAASEPSTASGLPCCQGRPTMLPLQSPPNIDTIKPSASLAWLPASPTRTAMAPAPPPPYLPRLHRQRYVHCLCVLRQCFLFWGNLNLPMLFFKGYRFFCNLGGGPPSLEKNVFSVSAGLTLTCRFRYQQFGPYTALTLLFLFSLSLFSQCIFKITPFSLHLDFLWVCVCQFCLWQQPFSGWLKFLKHPVFGCVHHPSSEFQRHSQAQKDWGPLAKEIALMSSFFLSS